ncbi:flagellar basal body rod protein FlgB [Ferrimonas lipolytica]|uniref:Flagellar basal body rod protein FlgB n=1 Tax=Ferrimonas lipolytica TaxID=2724191 RepID=A0A6H1UHI7_9GAMM|nr:flagellar basal body rod protein FlgB [Ferrimonas lipolytica]QIZ77252.1 flagellar basal body rod protein FlgB [Ferrimonas lipolytica]
MGISFDNALGIHQHTLGVRAQRAEVLSGNIANADTPGYKAQELDFEAALNSAKHGQSMQMTRSHENHISHQVDAQDELLYRVPLQPDTGDGNTVDLQQERNAFMQNSLEYQASLEFLGSKFSGMKKALRGE